MKVFTTLLILFLVINLQAQDSKKHSDLFGESSQNITNELTEKHVEVPGKRVKLIPPEGYKFSAPVSGFEGPGSDAISVMHNKHGVEAHITEFRPERLEKKGFTNASATRLTINGFVAIYSQVTNVNSIYCNLLIGDEYNSILIMATVAKENEKRLAQVKEALLSVIYEKGPVNKDLAVAGFEIDLTDTDLYFDRTFSGVFVFKTQDGETEDGRIIRSSVIITQVNSNPEMLKKQRELIDVEMSRAKSRADQVEVIAEGQSKVDGMDAEYITAKVDAAGNNSMVHFTMTGNNKHMFKIQAVTVNDDDHFKLLEKIISTFKVKK